MGPSDSFGSTSRLLFREAIRRREYVLVSNLLSSYSAKLERQARKLFELRPDRAILLPPRAVTLFHRRSRAQKPSEMPLNLPVLERFDHRTLWERGAPLPGFPGSPPCVSPTTVPRGC